jgi:hypothetical protein
MFRRFSVAPRDANRMKTLAAMFASLALFAATKAHAAVHHAQPARSSARMAQSSQDRLDAVRLVKSVGQRG